MAIDLNLTPPPSPVNEIQPANVQNQELQEDQDDADAGDQNQLAPPSPLHNQNQEVHEHQNHAAADGDLNQMEPPSPVDEIQPENAENQDQEVEEHVNQNPQPLQQLQLDLNRTPPPSPVDANVENHNQANAGDQHPQQNQGLVISCILTLFKKKNHFLGCIHSIFSEIFCDSYILSVSGKVIFNLIKPVFAFIV